MKLKSIVVEDEQNSRELLLNILDKYCPEVEVHGVATGVEEATQLIRAQAPDLVFLDIELQDGVGFDVFKNFTEFDFLTIFITGYEQFGIEAIKHSAVDYLLKPISIKELQEAIARAKLRIKPWSILKQLDQSTNTDELPINGNKLVLSSGKSSKIIPCEEVIYVSADEPYSRLTLTNQSKILVQIPLFKISEMLPAFFFKIHRSHIINLHQVTEWDKGRGGNVLLRNGEQLPISYRIKKSFIEAWGAL